MVSPHYVYLNGIEDNSSQKKLLGIVTLIWLIPSVNLHMLFKIASMRKSLITMGTLVCRCKNNINKNNVCLFLYGAISTYARKYWARNTVRK